MQIEREKSYVPKTKKLSDIYDEDALSNQTKRYESMREKFKEIYGYEAKFFVRSPGRVNLIGEHVDYSDYPVLPMAIEQDTVIAVGLSCKENHISLANMNSDKFPSKKFEGRKFEDVTIDQNHTWSNYFVCGFKGILEHVDLKESKAMDLLVDGRVPIVHLLKKKKSFFFIK